MTPNISVNPDRCKRRFAPPATPGYFNESNELLENVPLEEQEIRTARHAKFCALLVAGTPVLSFTFRRRAHDHMIFREFTSSEVLYKYCTPNGVKTLKHQQFQVVLQS